MPLVKTPPAHGAQQAMKPAVRSSADGTQGEEEASTVGEEERWDGGCGLWGGGGSGAYRRPVASRRARMWSGRGKSAG
jgi:hypothetical protein